jgi:hypothetical protein
MSQTLHTLTHGLTGLEVNYAITLVAMQAGLLHVRAPWKKFPWTPLIAVPVMLMSALVNAVLSSLLGPFGAGQESLSAIVFAVTMFEVIGYVAGRMMAARRDESTTPAHRVHRLEGSVTLADILVRTEDEIKHFKPAGTSGTAKSTAQAPSSQEDIRARCVRSPRGTRHPATFVTSRWRRVAWARPTAPTQNPPSDPGF